MKIRGAAASAVVAGLLLPVSPAYAHGAPSTPISRTAACASGGTATGSAACKAARKANGGTFGAFDNLRIAGVDGRDRDVVPDGQLCSGGLAPFRGLDIARDDFPATKVTAGQRLAVRYRTTIPHEGKFRVYLTRAGYDAGKKLTWDDLGGKPIATVVDPPVRDGAYTFSAKLPAGRTGRHILYIVWQTTNTPDTYYSCSDLVFPAAPAPSPSVRATTKAPVIKKAAKPAASSTPAAAVATTSPAAPLAKAPDVTPVSNTGSDVTLGHQIIAGGVLLAAAAAAWAGIDRLRRRRRANR